MASSAAAILKAVRERAGLTQVELARRAGVAQSVVSAYEQGRRIPGFDAFDRLITAAGGEIVVEYRSSHDRIPASGDAALRHRDPAWTGRGRKVAESRTRLAAIAAEAGVGDVFLFGSVARGTDGPDSDVDLAITAPDGIGLLALAALTRTFEDLLDERVDLVPLEAATNAVRAAVERDGIRL